jgi:hypothetical protein
MIVPTLKWFARFLRRPVCDHDYKLLSQDCEGVTLSWQAEPVRSMRIDYECSLCGHKKTERGMYNYMDRERNPDWYGPDGWPINPTTGEKLRIVP